MGDRLIISDNREDPGNPLVLDGEAIDAAARDPLAIGKLPGSPGELPPEAPTDPYVALSRHTAPIIHLALHWLDASARTDHDDQT